MRREPSCARKLRARAQWKLGLVLSKIPAVVSYNHNRLLDHFIAALLYTTEDLQHLEQRIQAIPEAADLYELLKNTQLCDMTRHLVACRTALTEYLDSMTTIVT